MNLARRHDRAGTEYVCIRHNFFLNYAHGRLVLVDDLDHVLQGNIYSGSAEGGNQRCIIDNLTTEMTSITDKAAYKHYQ